MKRRRQRSRPAEPLVDTETFENEVENKVNNSDGNASNSKRPSSENGFIEITGEAPHILPAITSAPRPGDGIRTIVSYEYGLNSDQEYALDILAAMLQLAKERHV